ncbi:MAG: hypothetical protein QM733_15625 [Ilumatobacteraceae bacterium]
MSTVLWVVVPLVVVVLMYWLSLRIEPHWVSKDGHRFITTVQAITGHGEPEGRPKEAKVLVLPNDRLQLSQRRFLAKSLNEQWRVAGKSPTPPKRKAVYLLHAADDDGAGGQLALKLPDNSRAVPILDEIVARRGDWR